MRRLVIAALCLAPAAGAGAQAQPKMEVLSASVEKEISGGMLGDGVRAIDTTVTKLAVVTVRVPRGTDGGISTKDIVVQVAAAKGTRVIECEGYAPVTGSWMFVNRKNGMSSLTFFAGGTGTIDMRFMFPVPKATTTVQFRYKNTAYGEPLTLP